MAKAVRVYWDACVWLAIINEEREIPLGSDVENRFAMCNAIIEQAKDGLLEIITSTFTLAEICRHSQSHKLPSFLDHEYILTVPVDKNIALKAQHLQLAQIANIKPADAVHLASAQRTNVEEFHSFDNDFLKLENIYADNKNLIKFCKPNLGQNMPSLF